MRKKYIDTEIISERNLSSFKDKLDRRIKELQNKGQLFEIQFSVDASVYSVLILVYQEV